MSENNIDKKTADKEKAQRIELWIKTEKKITMGFDPEDLRTSGLLSIDKKNWMAVLLRLSEAVRFGVRDLQTLDALGEAAYRTKTPQALLPFQNEYTDPAVAVHMARAFLMMGDILLCRKYLAISIPTLLSEAITAVTKFEKNIETAMDAMTTPLKNPSENLNLIEYWQALAPVAEVSENQKLLFQAERKLKAYAYDRPVVHFNQSLRLLACGEISAGWKLYDWRLVPGSPCAQPMVCADISVWEGQNLSGQKLLVVLENGFGDQIFSLRYARALINDGIQIMIATSPEMFELVQFSFPELNIHLIKNIYDVNYWKNSSRPDYWVYAFSIPARSKHFDYVCTAGYLNADRSLTEKIKFEIQLINPQNLQVQAICWHGDIRTPAMRTRAYSVTEFLEQTNVFKNPCVLVNLQKDITPDEFLILQREALIHHCILINPANDLVGFSVTAAWMKNCDHIYSCDTAVAHLSGALGLKSTVLIRNKSIWHWISHFNCALDKYFSKWYTSVEVKYALNPKYSYMFDIRVDEEIK